MALTRRGRLRNALAEPFPAAWRQILSRRMWHWSTLDGSERERLEKLIRTILTDKLWEASNGFALSEEIRILIAAMACVPILGLEYDYYRRVTSIIVCPTIMVVDGYRPVGEGVYTEGAEAIIGQARHEGPVLIAWDAARDQALHPEGGHNVVYHEFAHKLDMLDGGVDGTPPFESAAAHKRWVDVCGREFAQLRRGFGGELLDPYGAENPGEFFAVLTEVFFCRSLELKDQKPALYDVLQDFYKQDPAARVLRAPRR